MSVRRPLTVLASACGLAALVAAPALVAPGPAEAAVVTPLSLVYESTVFGRATSVGNGVMRCPTASDGVNLRAGTSYEACAAAQAGTVPAGLLTNNNEYSMRHQDDDALPETFDASSARLTVPAGAEVRYAVLTWGGHTGEYRAAGGGTSAIRSCNVIGQQYAAQFPTSLPPAPAAASPEAQAPGLQIGGGARVEVVPDAVTRDSLAAWPTSSDRFYTGIADVTALLRAAAPAGDVDVTVSNVWAPAGVNCAGGWGLTVVWAFDAPQPGVIEYANRVSVHAGHVRQGSADAPSSVQVSGFEAASSTNRVGIVAYEGDRGHVGDRFSINGTDVPEPTGFGTLNDYFVSAANGSTSPAWPVNFSVDVNELGTSLVPAGSTDATLGFRTNGDGYWLQAVWLETPEATVDVTKTADIARGRTGDPVTWTITVTNPSPARLASIRVTDALEPACDREVPTEQVVSGSYTYSCTSTLGADSVVNTAVVTAVTEAGATLVADAAAAVEVIHPALTVTKTADRALYRDGEQARFEVVTTNTGDTPLTQVTVADARVPGCSAVVGALAPGESRSTTCAATAPLPGGANTATATGLDVLGRGVEATGSVPVPVAAPALTVRKSVSAPRVAPGGTVRFTVEVTNTGDVRLDDVVLDDDAVPGCSARFGTLLPGESGRTTCTWRADSTDGLVNVARATGTALRCTDAAPAPCEALGGPPVTAEDSAAVRVAPDGGTPGGPSDDDPAGRSGVLGATGAGGIAAALAAAVAAVGIGAALVRTRRA